MFSVVSCENPFVQAHAGEDSEQNPRDNALSSHLKILVIEDDEDDFVIIKNLLQEIGSPRFDLDLAQTYDSGVEAICRAEHDAVLLDYYLGERNGLDLLREVAAKGCPVPIILLTGLEDSAVDIDAMNAGAADYLTKGQITSNLLERSIRYSISRKRAELELKNYHEQLEELVNRRTEQLDSVNHELRMEIERRKRVQEALEGSEERLRLFIEHAPASLAMFDRAMRYLAFSRRWLSDYGLGERDLRGMSHYEVFPEISECWKEAHRRGLAGETVCADADRFVRANGAVEWLRWEIRPWHDSAGEVAGILIFTEDITTEKKQEEELLRVNRILRALSDTNQAAIDAEDEPEFLASVCRTIVNNCGYPGAWIGFAQDDENQTPRPVAQAWGEEGYVEKAKATRSNGEPGLGPVGAAIGAGPPCVLKDMQTEYRVRPWREEAMEQGDGSSIAIPLKVDERTRGALTIYSKEPGSFSDGEAKLLVELAGDLAYGIKVLRLRMANRQSEQKLMESRARLDQALQSARMGSWHYDLPENRRYFDDQTCELLGVDPSKFTGTAEEFLEVLHPDDRGNVREALIRAIEQDAPYDPEYRVVGPDGSVRHLTSRGRLVRDDRGNPAMIHGVIWDVTERKKAEEALRVGEQRFRTLFDHIPYVAFVLDRDHRRVTYNQASLAYFKGQVGTKTLDLTGVSRATKALWHRVEEQTIQSGSPTWYVEMASSPSRGAVYHETWLRPFEEREGQVQMIVGITQDITDHIRLMRDLESARAELERRVRERTAELVETNRQLKLEIEDRLLAEDALRESEEKFSVAFKRAPAFAAITSAEDGAILDVNDMFTAVSGFTREELLGRTSVEVGWIRAEDRPRLIEEMLKQDKVPGVEMTLYAKHGKPIECLCKSELVTIGGVRYLLTMAYDITASKRAEEALRASREMLRTVLNTVPAAIFWKDLNLRYLGCNHYFLRDAGFQSPEEVEGKDDFDMPWLPEQAEAFRSDDRSVIETGRPKLGYEEPFVSAKGGKAWARTNKIPLLNSEGQVDGVLGTYEDITERKKAEVLLRRYELLSKHTREIILFISQDGRILEANEAACAAYGYDRETILSLNIHDLRSPEARDQIRDQMGKTFAEDIFFESEHVRKDGSVFSVEVSSRGVEIGEEKILLSIIRDITERKKAEEQVRKSKETLQKVFDGISDPLIMLDRNGLIMLLNRAAKNYYHLHTYKDAMHKACFEGFRGRSAPCEGCQQPFSGMGGDGVTFEREGGNDPDRVEQVVTYPLESEAGVWEGTIIRITDITQAKQMQRHLFQSQKLASLGLLVSGIAHEINNPNNFIVFNLPILRDYLDMLMPVMDSYAQDHPGLEYFGMSYAEFRKDLYKLLENMEHGSQRINATVSRLKSFTQTQDKRELRLIDLKYVIDQAIAICRGEIRKKVKSLDVSISDNLPPVFADSEATMEQILINLLINAAHAADKEDSWIRLSVQAQDWRPDWCVIEVSDNGCGMDEKTREKIFDPFFTTKSSMMGTGLGLYICKNLLEGLGGRIEFESRPGEGSTFRVFLQHSAPGGGVFELSAVSAPETH